MADFDPPRPRRAVPIILDAAELSVTPLSRAAGLALPDLGAKASVVRVMTRQAYLMSANDNFCASGWACFIVIGLVWLCRRVKAVGGAPVAADDSAATPLTYRGYHWGTRP